MKEALDSGFRQNDGLAPTLLCNVVEISG